jgi:DNA invertase Pin-like site-specific DNA recombinase
MTKAPTTALDAIDQYTRPRLRAVLYLRVSTEEQVEGYGLPAGEKSGLAYIERKGWEHVHTYRDPGVSGSLQGSERPDLNRLLKAAPDGGFDVVVVSESRVIGRTDRAYYTWVWELEDQGIFVADARTGMDNTTEEGRDAMREEAHYAFKEYTRIKNRTQAGIQEKALAGGYSGGKPKFGYRIENLGKKALSRQVPDICDGKEACVYEHGSCTVKHEADSLRHARRLVVKHKGDWHKAALALNTMGYRRRNGKDWTGGDLRIVMMRKDLHDGVVRFRAVRGGKTGRDPVVIQMDRVFTDEEIAELKAAVKPRKARKDPESFLLSGRVASLCGSYYVGRSSHYMCRERRHKNTCDCPAIDAGRLDAWAWSEVRALMGDGERLKALAQEYVGLTAGNKVNYLKRLADLDQRIAELNEVIDLTPMTAAQSAARRRLSREEAQAAVERAVRPAEKELLDLERQRAQVAAWQADAESASRRAADLQAMAETARHRLDDFTREQREEFLGLLNVQLAVKGQRREPSTRSKVVMPPIEMTGDIRPGVLAANDDTATAYSWVNDSCVIVRFSAALAA